MRESGKTLRWLSRSAGRYQVHIGLMLLLQALLGGTGVLMALLMRTLVDTAVGRDQPGFLRAALLLAGLTLLQLGARALLRFLRDLGAFAGRMGPCGSAAAPAWRTA